MSFLNRFLDGKPQDDTLQSIVRNLTHLLNARRGYGSPLCDFGLGAYYMQHGTKGAAESVMREVLHDVSAYEPRLKALEVKVLNDGQLPLAFELRGELRVEQGRVLAPHVQLVPCRLAILFDPIHGEIAIQVLEDAGVR